MFLLADGDDDDISGHSHSAGLKEVRSEENEEIFPGP